MVPLEIDGQPVRLVRRFAGSTVLLLALLAPARPGAAQNWGAVGGAVAGAGAGAWVGLGYMTVRARRGVFVDAPGYQSKEIVLPSIVGFATGIGLGAHDEDRLADTALWSAAGWGVGLGVGALIGRQVWDDPEAPWAGAVIGGGVGLLVGGIVGFVRSGEGNDPMPAMFRIPL